MKYEFNVVVSESPLTGAIFANQFFDPSVLYDMLSHELVFMNRDLWTVYELDNAYASKPMPYAAMIFHNKAEGTKVFATLDKKDKTENTYSFWVCLANQIHVHIVHFTIDSREDNFSQLIIERSSLK